MPSDLEKTQNDAPAKPELQKMTISDLTIRDLLDIANAFFSGQNEVTKGDIEVDKLQIEKSYEAKQINMRLEHQKYVLVTLVLSAFGLFVLCISAALIFYKDNTQAGVLLLTHLIAFAAGVFARRQASAKKERDNEDGE